MASSEVLDPKIKINHIKYALQFFESFKSNINSEYVYNFIF